MQQQFNELRQAIATDIAERFDASERRLREGLSRDLDTKLEARGKRLREGLAKDLEDRFVARDRHLSETLTQVIVQQLETSQQHLEGRLQLHMEDLTGLVTRAAEGYVGTLDGIERKLGELNEKVDTKFSDHDKALADHNQRLGTLERARRRGQRG